MKNCVRHDSLRSRRLRCPNFHKTARHAKYLAHAERRDSSSMYMLRNHNAHQSLGYQVIFFYSKARSMKSPRFRVKPKDLKRPVIKTKVDVTLISHGAIVSLKKIKKKSKANTAWSAGKRE